MVARRKKTRPQATSRQQSAVSQKSQTVPLTAREKRQVDAQLKLARAEVARLKAIVEGRGSRVEKKSPSGPKRTPRNTRRGAIAHSRPKVVFAPIVPPAQRKRVAQLIAKARKRLEAPKNAATLRRIKKLEDELRALSFVKENLQAEIESYRLEAETQFEEEPQRDVQSILPLARKREYVDKPVNNIHVNNKNWIVGTTPDSLGNPMPVRCWVVYNSENNKFNVRWILWFAESNLPKRGVTDTDEKYEDLSPQKYYVYGIFIDSKRIEKMRSEMFIAANELEFELQDVLRKIETINHQLSALRRSLH